MDESHRDSNKIFENVMNRIDEAQSLNDITPFLKVVPLNIIKQCLKHRMQTLQDGIMSSSNNNAYNNSICSTQYNEMRKLALSISPITDILSTDLIIHTISFLITTADDEYYREKEVVRYFQCLPVLSKSFQAIMNNTFFYNSSYPLYIHDIDPKKKKKSDKTDANPFDIHISADHQNKKLEIMHLKTKKIRSTKTIKKVPKLIAIKVSDSLLPWKNRSELIIKGNISLSAASNPNVINILSQTNPKFMSITGIIPEFRLNSYPSFNNVISLSIYNLQTKHSSNLTSWLNTTKFPSLQILKIKIPKHMTSNNLNKLINSLNVYALYLDEARDEKHEIIHRKFDIKITSSKLTFLCLGGEKDSFFGKKQKNHFKHSLDITKCDSLIGICCNIQIPFSSITWNKQHKLKFINIRIDDREINNQYSMKWYDAYNNNSIYSDIVIGNCFYKTPPKTQKLCKYKGKHCMSWMSFIENNDENNSENSYHRRRSMTFKEMMDYIENHLNDGNQMEHGWYTRYNDAILNQAYWIQNIAKNFPRYDM